MRPDNTTDLGRRAEDRALSFLTGEGLDLIERNYRCKAGEIDLVMQQQSTLVLVEVRSRSRSDFGSAAETVGRRKQRRFIRAARHLLLARPDLARLYARFDVIAIDGDAPNDRLQWIKDAFRTGF